MKNATLTIRLDKELYELLTKVSKRSGKNRSEIAREALRRQLHLDSRFRENDVDITLLLFVRNLASV
ncbi:MAG: hypothetical protein DRG83_19950 [Deltaproteobacteria bacterium]|nr:MAG: hypothetical protein DRG83_19950 [Deltaproteobacteria bacterium]